MNILLNGGSVYIGAYTAEVLSQAGHEVVLSDNFCNSNPSALDRLQKILGKALPCIEGGVRDADIVERVLREYKIDPVIHFAGLKAVGESAEKPIEYYANNVQGALSLLEVIKLCSIKTLVFSAGATVYGDPQYLPYDENHPTEPTNIYGRTKLQAEEILKGVASADRRLRIVCLRYFNPVGAHNSGFIGEDPHGGPDNLLSFLMQVASGNLSRLNIYGTGERDYIHVIDLAEGYVASLSCLKNCIGFGCINLCTGIARSVIELIKIFELATGQKIESETASRRKGDLPVYCANSHLANELLRWRPKEMLEGAWSWRLNSLID
ncbi:UDP-glucose 4-epimerase GalE [Polynucleobacter sp. es-MAR-4]|uniref:UDP-glucose 4-epimerase GalE n=1 Tax=Polynucleobacter sp. es-MAR-4 TaxID=1855655 RepID=UPI001C0B5D6B|nr:UDP-glucose 4-epimerase GalE [Polynucleobacter sp. es-MAR-4]MBU3637581.1 UDP-glucose 4-epimerase GalE [Polynucleobacter sp. es-MAR-4]